MSRQGERVDATCMGLPEGFHLSWERIYHPYGIRWTMHWHDEWVADFDLEDGAQRMADGSKHQNSIKELWEKTAEEHLSQLWDKRIAAASTLALPPPAPLLLANKLQQG